MQTFIGIDSYFSGFLVKTHVYALMGPDGSRVFAKIGRTENLLKRLRSLASECPGPPAFAACIAMSSRRRALLVESELHKALEKWRSHGREWFHFAPEDKQAVNDVSRMVLTFFNEGGRPLRWTPIDISAIASRQRGSIGIRN